MQKTTTEISSSDELISRRLKRFNRREILAFSDLYEELFDTIYYFAKKIFIGTDISPEDVIHDIFLSIWEHKSLTFETTEHLKGYLYLSIRNYIKNWKIKQIRKNKFKDYIKNDSDYFVSQIIETEIISEISNAIELLPTESAKVLRMTIEGWDIKEIAEKLGKSQSTIYNQKATAIQSLRKKLYNQHFTFFISILEII